MDKVEEKASPSKDTEVGKETGVVTRGADGKPVAAQSDAEAGRQDEGAYDVDFEYLASPKTGVEKKEPVPPEKKEPVSEEKKEPESKFPVPPAAQTKESDKASPTSEEKKEPSTPDKGTDWEVRYKELQSFSDARHADDAKKIEEYEKQVKLFDGIKTFKEELERDPVAVLHKYFPALAEKLDPRKFITDKLRAEFGEFTYDPAEAYVEGTTSYKVKAREQELLEQLSRERLTIEATRKENERTAAARLESSKREVMKRYGLSEEQFEREIVEFAKNTPIDFMRVAQLKYFDWHIQQAVKDAIAADRKERPEKSPTSLTTVGGGATDQEASQAYKEAAELFGDM